MNDTLISVTTCAKNKDRMEVNYATWIASAKAVGLDVEVFDGDRTGVPDDYINVPRKYQVMCRWALERGYKRVLSMDDDSYLNVPRFKVVDFDYAGWVFPPDNAGLPNYGIADYPKERFPHSFVCGGAFWMSESSMRIVAETPRKVWTAGDESWDEDWAGDRWVGHILAEAGVGIQHLPDYVLLGNRNKPQSASKNTILTSTVMMAVPLEEFDRIRCIIENPLWEPPLYICPCQDCIKKRALGK